MIHRFCSCLRNAGMAVVTLVLVSMPVVSQAEYLAMDDSSEIYSNITQSGTIGQPFELTSTSIISGLGVFDLDSDGLNEDHEVAIWSCTEDEETGDLVLDELVVGPTTVSSSGNIWASVSGSGQFVVQPITQVVLEPGSYMIGGFYTETSDSGLADGPYVEVPGITRQEKTYWIESSELTFPTTSFEVLRTFVTFTVTTQDVPEPSGFVLVLMGLSMLLCRRR